MFSKGWSLARAGWINEMLDAKLLMYLSYWLNFSTKLYLSKSTWVEVEVEVEVNMFMLGLIIWIFIYMLSAGVWTMDILFWIVDFLMLWIFIYMIILDYEFSSK